MIIRLNNRPYYLAETDRKHNIWFPVSFKTGMLREEIIRKKLGETDPQIVHELQMSYQEYRHSPYDTEEDHFEHYILNLGKDKYPFHIIDHVNNGACIYIEKGLFTLGTNRPSGYAWAHINADDDPETIQIKLYDHRKQFGEVMHRKLRKICGW